MTVIRRNLIVVGISIVLQGVWEYVACGAFYNVGAVDDMVGTMMSATLGDVIITLMVFNGLWLLNNKMNWVADRKDYAFIVLYGFASAMYFESRALALERWQYASEMLVLLDTEIGLVPIIQLMVLLPMTIKIENYINNR